MGTLRKVQVIWAKTADLLRRNQGMEEVDAGYDQDGVKVPAGSGEVREFR